jgi:hypothetical protein
MMQHQSTDNFREGGADAWWTGLRDAVKSATERLKCSASDDERREAQAQLDELARQKADAERNGDRWLF